MSLDRSSRGAGIRSFEGRVGRAEVMALKSGLGKKRAERAVEVGIDGFHPSVAIDTGSCGALDPDLKPGTVVIATDCYDYELLRSSPLEVEKKKLIPSALSYLPEQYKQDLLLIAHSFGIHLVLGRQGCGEFFVNTTQKRNELYELLGAAGANWETSAVFLSAYAKEVFPLSFRIVTDSANERALMEFVLNIRKEAARLYSFIAVLMEKTWLEEVVTALQPQREDIFSYKK
jgi:adenosylhomocysteine nucleosidase